MKPVTEHASSWLCGPAAPELLVIMSACGGHQQEPNTTNDTASREGSVPGYRHFLTLLSGVVVGMPAAGPEAHLPDGEAVSGKPLSRAGPLAPGTRSLQGDPVCILLWSLLQRCQPKASNMSVRTAGRSKRNLESGKWWGKPECRRFSCLSAFRVANVSLLSLAQPSSVKMG